MGSSRSGGLWPRGVLNAPALCHSLASGSCSARLWGLVRVLSAGFDCVVIEPLQETNSFLAWHELQLHPRPPNASCDLVPPSSTFSLLPPSTLCYQLPCHLPSWLSVAGCSVCLAPFGFEFGIVFLRRLTWHLSSWNLILLFSGCRCNVLRSVFYYLAFFPGVVPAAPWSSKNATNYQ